MHKVYLFQTMPEFATLRKGTIFELIYYALPFAAVFTLLDHGVHYFLDDWFMNHFINENKYPDIDKRRKRCYTFSKWAFSQFYYLPISFWAYSILKDTSFMPHWLGGNGSCINLEAYMYTFD